MENTMNKLNVLNAFESIDEEQMMEVDGGGWAAAVVALGGTIKIAGGVIVAVGVPGGTWVGVTAILNGIAAIASLR